MRIFLKNLTFSVLNNQHPLTSCKISEKSGKILLPNFQKNVYWSIDLLTEAVAQDPSHLKATVQKKTLIRIHYWSFGMILQPVSPYVSWVYLLRKSENLRFSGGREMEHWTKMSQLDRQRLSMTKKLKMSVGTNKKLW